MRALGNIAGRLIVSSVWRLLRAFEDVVAPAPRPSDAMAGDDWRDWP